MDIHETAYGMSLMINNLGNIYNETQLTVFKISTAID